MLAAGGAADWDDYSETAGSVFHELLLESAFPAGVSPGELLVDVEEAVDRQGQGDDTPANGAPHLRDKHS